MSVRPYRDIHRRVCRKIHVGEVPVGGDAPITVQSMTNTLTSDIEATVAQVQALEAAGALRPPRGEADGDSEGAPSDRAATVPGR